MGVNGHLVILSLTVLGIYCCEKWCRDSNFNLECCDIDSAATQASVERPQAIRPPFVEGCWPPSVARCPLFGEDNPYSSTDIEPKKCTSKCQCPDGQLCCSIPRLEYATCVEPLCVDTCPGNRRAATFPPQPQPTPNAQWCSQPGEVTMCCTCPKYSLGQQFVQQESNECTSSSECPNELDLCCPGAITEKSYCTRPLCSRKTTPGRQG